MSRAARGLSRRGLLGGALSVGLGSGFASAQMRGSRSIRVITTFTILQDMTRAVAGSGVEVTSVAGPETEVHEYQPTSADILKAQASDLVLWNGLNLERWFERFFGNVRMVPSAVVTEGIATIPIADGPYAGRANPHAWMSPANGLIYVDNIRKALIDIVPASAQDINRNAEAYGARIRSLDATLRTSLAALPPDRRWLVTSEGALSYLARDYGLQEASIWPINSDEQGTPRQIRRIVDLVRQHRIPVVFSETTVPDRAARQVAKESGARYGGALHVDALTGPGGPAPSYLDLLRATVGTIVKGFNPA